MNRHNLFTSSFKKNIKFGLKLLSFGLLVAGYIIHIIPQYSENYNASLIDKVNRLKSIQEPKIVLLGNSNVSFGIDSAELEAELKMPVVDMGLHGGLGNAFHEEMAKLNVKEGDIYILCHSTFTDGDVINDPTLAWLTLEDHYHLWDLIRLKDIPALVNTFPIYLKRCLNLYASGTGNQEEGGVYSRKAFNEYGDVAVLREGSEYVFRDQVEPSQISDMTAERINELNLWLSEHGATLLVAGYPIGNGDLTADAEKFIDFQLKLEEKLDCPVISNYIEYMLDYTYF